MGSVLGILIGLAIAVGLLVFLIKKYSPRS